LLLLYGGNSIKGSAVSHREVYHVRSVTKSIALLLVMSALVVVAGCGGIEPIVFVADEEATVKGAEKAEFKFCHIRTDDICQSPDSALVFQMPKSLSMVSANRSIIEELVIANQGFAPVTIEEYFLTIVDDRQVRTPVRFSGPGGYNETSPFSPALVIQPGDEVPVSFSGAISIGATAVNGLAIAYRLAGGAEMTTVVVSYRPSLLGTDR
jgi:hypothetical protein